MDDLLLVVMAVGTFLAVSTFGRRRRAAEDAPAPERCPYCDQSLEPHAVRCDRCGFRTPRYVGRHG